MAGPAMQQVCYLKFQSRNRASRARLDRSRWELTRAMHEFQQTTDVAFTEVEVAVRETQTALGEMVTKQQAIEAASHEVSYLNQRWKLLPDPERISGVVD